MNEIFNIKRFWTYLKYDLDNAKDNFGISMLVCGLLPIIFYIFYSLFSLLISGNAFAFSDSACQATALLTSLCVIALSMPVKLYGNMTEKRYGRQWLMIPVSALEKLISLLLIVCVIAPAAYFVLFFGCDLLISVFVKDYHALLPAAGDMFEEIKSSSEMDFGVPIPFLLWMNWCQYMLFFTLGSIVFKKGKIAKSFLCLAGFTTILTTILVAFLGSDALSSNNFGTFAEGLNTGTVASVINLILNIWYIIYFGALIGGTYLRIKKLQH